MNAPAPDLHGARASDEKLGGSEWIQYFCHPKALYKSFVSFLEFVR